MNKNINELSCNLIKEIETNVLKIIEVLNLEFDSLINNINKLPSDAKDLVIEFTINKLLSELKLKLTIEKYQLITRKVDEITDYYASKRNDFDVILEEGDKVANDLLFKVIGLNKRSVDLPIKLDTIKNFCLSSDIKEDLVYDTLLWIIIRYVSILKCL